MGAPTAVVLKLMGVEGILLAHELQPATQASQTRVFTTLYQPFVAARRLGGWAARGKAAARRLGQENGNFLLLLKI